MMPPLPLTLVHPNRETAAVSAGWLASGDPLEWLREVAHARAQGCHLAIYPVAASLADPRAIGVFLLPRGGEVPAFRARVMPLVEILPGIHGPQDAGVSAGLLPNEISFIFPYPLHFFHPSVGVVGFDPKDELSPAKLLRAGESPARQWNRAVPAPEAPPALTGIRVIVPDAVENLLEDVGREIGDKSGKLPDEKKSIVGKLGTLGAGLLGGGVLGVDWIWGKLTGGSTGPEGKGSITRWAEENWEKLTEGRQSEIERLMKLMEDDPDLGLRYALPLTGTSSSRGPTPTPGWKLGERSMTFKMGGGNQAVDAWDIGNKERLALERQYREAAQREIALGRHERAAYILGNLLGDWNGAAKALIAAGRHHDAVALYRNKLNNPHAAARCLEDAGLLSQAADLYIETKQHEKAGDLHAQLGNDAEARRLWGLAIEQQKDLFEKARIAQDKLADMPVALGFLESLWMSGNHPGRALGRMFAILKEEEGQAIGLLERIFEESPASMSLLDRLITALNEMDRRAEQPAFRQAVEARAYRHIGQALVSNVANATALARLLPRLDSQDSLLDRDARRYAAPKARLVAPKTPRAKGEIRRPVVIPIRGEGRWQSVTWLKKGPSVAGHRNGALMAALLRTPECLTASIPAPQSPSGNAAVRHLGVVSPRGNSRLFHFPGTGRLHYRALDRARTPADDAIGDLQDILSIGRHEEGEEFMLLVHTVTGTLSVHVYSEAAVLRRTVPIDFAPPPEMKLDWYCAGHGGSFCFTAEGFFAWRHPGGEFDTIALDDYAGGLHLSSDPVSPRVLLPRRHEVLLIEPGKPGKPLETINLFSEPAGPMPVACFTRDGHVVVTGEDGGAVYAPGNYVDPIHRLVIPSDVGHPIDACPCGDDGFVFLTSTGNLLVFS